MTFEEWMKEVDKTVEQMSGASVHDLSDNQYYDWFTDEMDPAEAARKALLKDGFSLKEFEDV